MNGLIDEVLSDVLFELPTFFLDNGHVFFINGRHRTVLLLDTLSYYRWLYLLPIPMVSPLVVSSSMQ